jgi:hypothetical protein
MGSDKVGMTEGAPIYDDLLRAGASALEYSTSLEPLIDGTQRQIQSLQEALNALRRRQRDFRAGGDGESQTAARVQQVLLEFGSSEWHLLADRRWPGTRRANLDLMLVGPPGVLLLDAKSWVEPTIRAGSLYRGQENADDELDKARRAAEAVSEVLVGVGLAPVAVRPMIVLVKRKQAAVSLDGVMVVGEKSLQPELLRLPVRLDSGGIAAVVGALDEHCPPASTLGAVTRHVVPRERPPASHQATVIAEALINTREIWEAALDAAAREPIETWMTWLHPAQAQLVTRRYSGPARIRGAAGTGKTVVALHRARELAKRPGARVLVTSFVRTLPQVQESLFHRLAPDFAGRVEFRGLHSWAARLLRARGTAVDVPRDSGWAAFERAWADVGQRGVLASSSLPLKYWLDEVQAVIKGRGISALATYLDLVRVGRRTPVREEQRRAVWDLYLAYQQHLLAQRHCDWSDVLLMALESVRDTPLAPDYTSVIVDEVQDLTCAGLQLLHALVGDKPDGLLLVGDGQQSVYVGGFALAEAGVSVTGRGTVLDRNYRNAGEVLKAAFEVVLADQFDDLEGDPVAGVREIEVDRQGGVVARRTARTFTEQRDDLVRALLKAIADGVRLGDIGVLVKTRRDVETWLVSLAVAGVAAISLESYDGTTTDAVKIGTYQRAKGLEFACVFLPDYDRAVDVQSGDEADDAYRERAELQRRQLFVAMTRARDRLWLCSRGAH